MSTTREPDRARGAMFERPDTPAQVFAAGAGLFLTTLGVLALILGEVDFGTVGRLADQPEFLSWTVSGWTTILWIATGGLGLLSMVRLDTARSYSLLAAVVLAIVAMWGFIDGRDVAGIVVGDATNNIMHAILAGLGLLVGMLPREAQRPAEPETRGHGTGRFDNGESVRRIDRPTMGGR